MIDFASNLLESTPAIDVFAAADVKAFESELAQ